MRYGPTLNSNISRKNLIIFIQKELNPNKLNNTTKTNNNSIIKIQSRNHHTQIIAPTTNDRQRFGWSMFWGIRLIARIIFYIITLDTLDALWSPTASNFRRISLDDFLNNMDAAYDAEVAEEAAWAVEDAAQDAYHAAGEQAATEINNPEGIYNLSYFNDQQASGTSTPNSQVSINSYESDSEMESDMEKYVNSKDSDTKSNSDMDISSDSDSDNKSNNTNNPNATSKSSTDLIPVIFFLTNKFSWNNILFALFLILLKIVLNDIDASLLLDSSIKMSDPTLTIDINTSEYISWFNSLDKQLPDLSLIDQTDLSIIPPIFFLRNKLLDKIIKDILRLIFQYFVNLITSILTSRINSALLSIGLFGLLKLDKGKDKGKGKAKEIDFNSDTESFTKIAPTETSKDPTETGSINSTSSEETELDSETEAALERDFSIESRIKAQSRKSFITEFLTKAKITPTKELQLEFAKMLLKIQQERQDSSISSVSSVTQSTNTELDVERYNPRNKGRDELDQDSPSSSTSTVLESIYPTDPETLRKIQNFIRKHRAGKEKVRLSTTSTQLDLDLDRIQRDEITEESITPLTLTRTKPVTMSEAEMHRLRKSWPPLPKEEIEQMLEEINNLNRFSDLKEDSKNRKLFRNLQRLQNSPAPTEDTQLRSSRTDILSDYEFKIESDYSDTKSFRDTFDDLSIDGRSYKAKPKTTPRLKVNKKNRNKKNEK
jgi:hypothetical protein